MTFKLVQRTVSIENSQCDLVQSSRLPFISLVRLSQLTQTLGEESTSALYNWLLKLAQALTPAAYIWLRRQSLIGLDVAVPAADWLRSSQEVRWIFSPRV
jgi:hypothetical protein